MTKGMEVDRARKIADAVGVDSGANRVGQLQGLVSNLEQTLQVLEQEMAVARGGLDSVNRELNRLLAKSGKPAAGVRACRPSPFFDRSTVRMSRQELLEKVPSEHLAELGFTDEDKLPYLDYQDFEAEDQARRPEVCLPEPPPKPALPSPPMAAESDPEVNWDTVDIKPAAPGEVRAPKNLLATKITGGVSNRWRQFAAVAVFFLGLAGGALIFHSYRLSVTPPKMANKPAASNTTWFAQAGGALGEFGQQLSKLRWGVASANARQPGSDLAAAVVFDENPPSIPPIVDPEITEARETARRLLAGHKVRAALAHLDSWVQAAPYDAEMRYLFGRALFQRRLVKLAAKHMKAAVDLDPNYTDAYYELAGLNLRLKRKEQARLALERVIELAPADRRSRSVRRLLRRKFP